MAERQPRQQRSTVPVTVAVAAADPTPPPPPTVAPVPEPEHPVAAGPLVEAPAGDVTTDGLVEVVLTQYHDHNGVSHAPGDTIRVAPERADALRWAGHARPADRQPAP